MSNCPQASILVVDSHAESLFTIAAILIAQNHKVQTATEASSAIQVAREHSLDLLITDTRLRDLFGIDLIAEIRTAPDHADLPVMFVTANQSPDVIRRSYSSGAAFHLKKPIDPAVLCELVEKALWMPHLVKSHVEQNAIRAPHVSFAKNPLGDPIGNPLTSPFDTGSIFSGTPTTF